MKHVLIVAACLWLTACSTFTPGDDPKGKKLQAEGDKVLDALHNYMDDTSRQPRSLQELVPKYLPKLPDDPKIVFDPKTGTLSFDYVQDGSNPLLVHCFAAIGQTSWVCN